MTLPTTNATISTLDGTTGLPVLVNEPCTATPGSSGGQFYNIPQGGILHYVVHVNPGRNIARGDTLFFTSWGQHTVDPTRRYRVFDVYFDGAAGGESLLCLVGDLVG